MTDMHKKPIKTTAQRHFAGETAKRLRDNGYNVNRVLETLDGDDVKVHALDVGHPYPVVGEVFDWNSNTSRLARWNEAGQYEGSLSATSKHSLRKNLIDGYTPIPVDDLPMSLRGLSLPRDHAAKMTRHAAAAEMGVDSFVRRVRSPGPEPFRIMGIESIGEMVRERLGKKPEIIMLHPMGGDRDLSSLVRLLDQHPVRVARDPAEVQFDEAFPEAVAAVAPETVKPDPQAKPMLNFIQAAEDALAAMRTGQHDEVLAEFGGLVTQARNYAEVGRLTMTSEQASDLPLVVLRGVVEHLREHTKSTIAVREVRRHKVL